MSVVYIILNENNDRFYIGSAKCLKARWRRHMYELRNNRHHNVDMQTDYNNGNTFIVNTVFESEDRNAAFAEELYLIGLSIEDPKCYNIGAGVHGGDNLTNNPKRSSIIEKMTASIREWIGKLTDAERKLKFGKFGKDNGMYGRTHTPAVKAMLSKLNKGRGLGVPKGPFSKAHRAKMSENAKLRVGKKNPFYGKKHTEETRAKLAKARTGNKPANSLRVSINGVIYESFTDAGRHLGLNTTVVRWRVMSKNPKYVEWRFVDECPENIESVPRTKKEQ